MGRSHECDHPPGVTGLPPLTEPKLDTAAGSREIDDRVRALVRDGLSVYRVDAERLRRFVVAIAGLGAYPILKLENGLHVWEAPGEGKSFERIKVRVHVVPQPIVPGETPALLLAQALSLIHI